MPPAAASAPDDHHSLSRSLRPRHVSMITIGGIIGAGLFVGSSAAISVAGPAVVLAYATAGLLVLMIMRMLGEMAVAMPTVRSFTEFARAGLGHWAGFSVGWLYWYFWVIVIPIEAIAGAKLLNELGLDGPVWLLGTVLMALMTAVNLMSARAYGEFEFWFAMIKVVAIILFILLLGSWAFGLTAPSGPTYAHLWSHGGFAPHGPLAVAASVTTVFFSMMGAEVVTIAAAESPEPARAVARMTSSVVGRILVFYVGSITMILCVIPWTLVQPGESPFAVALDAIHVPNASQIMKLIILTAVLSCLNSAFYVASRVLFVLAEKGDAPHWLVRTNARHVPTRAVLLASGAGFAGVLAAYFSPGVVFAFLVNAMGALIVFIYMAICVAQVRLRKARERAGAPPPSLTMWLFPWGSYLVIGALGLVIAAMAATPSMQGEFWASVLSVAVALGCFVVLRRSRAAVP